MKRRITLSIAVTLIAALVLLTSADQKTSAQGQMRIAADSGVITLGPNQILRMTIVNIDDGENIRVRFKQSQYIEQGNVYRASQQNTSAAITLGPNESAVVDGADYVVWRTQVLSNSRNVRVNGIVFDTSTQRVVSIAGTSTTMYWP